jgi:hypothetical protein
MTDLDHEPPLELAPSPAPVSTIATLPGEDAPAGLSNASSTKERLTALLDAGLPHAELRAAVGISDATLRNWLDEATVPRGGTARALDDLRVAVVALHHAGLSGRRGIQWLLSRNLGRWTRGARPIDLVQTDPLLLLAAVQDLLFPNEAEPPGTVHLCIQPALGGAASEQSQKAKSQHKKTSRRRAHTHA